MSTQTDARNFFRDQYFAPDGLSSLTVYIDEPAVDIDGLKSTNGNILLLVDVHGRHYSVGEEESIEQRVHVQDMFEHIAATQQLYTQGWLMNLYRVACDGNNDEIESAARQALIDAPGDVHALYTISYTRNNGNVPSTGFMRRDEFADVKSDAEPTRVESCIVLTHIDENGTMYQLYWNLMSQVVKVLIETQSETNMRVAHGKRSPALDIEVLPQDSQVMPTVAKLEAFLAAIEASGHNGMDMGSDDQ